MKSSKFAWSEKGNPGGKLFLFENVCSFLNQRLPWRCRPHCWRFPPVGRLETSRGEVYLGSGTNNNQCQAPCRPLTTSRRSRAIFLRTKKRFTFVCWVAKLEQEWGQGWPRYDTKRAAFQMYITLLSCLLDTGLYHSKVTFSLTLNQRLGN